MEEIATRVYESAIAVLNEELRLPWVENEMQEGKEFYHNYGAMLDAYERLRERLGVEDEDDDVEIIINALLDNEQILCLKMFRYGMEYQKKLEK